MTYIEQGISVERVAKVLKQSRAAVEAECADLNVFIGSDWAGEPAVSEREAQGLVAGTARREHDHDRAWRKHERALEAHVADREDARRAAYQTAYFDALRKGHPNPQAATIGHEAAASALERFDDKNAEPVFNNGIGNRLRGLVSR